MTVEAKLKLVELPRARATLVVQFADLLEALAATPIILRHQPAAVEVVDQVRARQHPAQSRGDPAPRLPPGRSRGDPPDRALRRPGRRSCRRGSPPSKSDLRQSGFGYHQLALTDPAAQARVWKLRTMALGLSMAEKGDAKAISFVEDTAVAPEHLRDYIAEFLAIIARHGTKAGVYAHASVGCLHVRPVINLKTEEGVRKFEAIAEEVADLVLKYGGALSGEHGDGLVRSPFQEKMYGPVLYQAFRELKRTFDPLNLLNPGKIVDAPPLAANLRYGPGYVTPAVPTTFDFSADGGLLPAAELCAGVGACRKKREGTMCPSFQATRDEKDSTRGRANLLRLAITGQLGFEGFTDPHVHEVLDLCLECKACKSECPTNVDMARLKAEFLHQYHRKHGFPWRNRVFGHVAELGRIGCALAPVSNWLARSGPSRWLNEKLLGIDRRRMPPAFARRSLVRRFSSLPWNEQSEAASRVLLFPDTFTNYFEPEVGEAAIELLQRAGLRGHARPAGPALLRPAADLQRPARPGRGQRPAQCRASPRLVAPGWTDHRLRAELHPDDQRRLPRPAQGRAPLPGRDGRRACLTFEEFLESILPGKDTRHARLEAGPAADPGAGTLPPAIAGRRRADAEAAAIDPRGGGDRPGRRLLRHGRLVRLRGRALRGFAARRRAALLPAVRQAGPGRRRRRAGFSCRLQIQHFTGREAVHPAVLLRSLPRLKIGSGGSVASTSTIAQSLHHRLIMIEHRLGQHGHGGAFGRIERRVARSVADGEQLARRRSGRRGTRRTARDRALRAWRAPAGWAGGRSACGRRT